MKDAKLDPLVALIFGVFVVVSVLITKRFGREFWLTDEGLVVAAVLGLSALLSFFLAFRRMIRQGRLNQ